MGSFTKQMVKLAIDQLRPEFERMAGRAAERAVDSKMMKVGRTSRGFMHVICIRAATRENRSSGFPTRSDTNRAVQSQKQARSLKFRI